jgi:uncharacterized protein YbaP (TraB family)
VASGRLKWIGWAALLAVAGPPLPAMARSSAAIAEAAPGEPARSVATRPAGRGAGEAEPRPAIWLLADDDTRIYLFGTIHILPPDLQWRSAELDRIVAESDELVMEIGEDPDELTPEQLFLPMMLGKTVPILSRVSPERREPLRRIIEASGMPADSFDQMQTWAAALLLSVSAIAQSYADEDVPPGQLTGVEDELRADFVQARRPISGVESSEEQLRFFSRMPLRAQRAFLESLVDASLAGEAVFDPEERGWVSGNTDTIAAEMAELPPELFDLLITRRNRNWTDWLIGRLERPGTVLFAVGAGHLAGRDSVQSMLAARGFRAARLNPAN